MTSPFRTAAESSPIRASGAPVTTTAAIFCSNNYHNVWGNKCNHNCSNNVNNRSGKNSDTNYYSYCVTTSATAIATVTTTKRQ